MQLSKRTDCTSPRENPNVSSGLWVARMWPCGFTSCNKHPTLVAMLIMGEAVCVWGKGAWRKSRHLLLNFAVNVKLLSKNKILKKPQNQKEVSLPVPCPKLGTGPGFTQALLMVCSCPLCCFSGGSLCSHFCTWLCPVHPPSARRVPLGGGTVALFSFK